MVCRLLTYNTIDVVLFMKAYTRGLSICLNGNKERTRAGWNIWGGEDSMAKLVFQIYAHAKLVLALETSQLKLDWKFFYAGI